MVNARRQLEIHHRFSSNVWQLQRTCWIWSVIGCLGLALQVNSVCSAQESPAPLGETNTKAIISLPDSKPQHALEMGEASKPQLNTQLLDQHSRVHEFREKSEKPLRVVVFINGDCPIARSYVPELNRLHEKWNEKTETVSLHAVWGNPFSTHAELRKFVEDYSIKFPIVFDPLAQLAHALKPTHVPETFLLNAQGKIAYRGRIDERWAAPGVKRAVVKSRDLETAVETLLLNPAARIASTSAVGCLYDLIPTQELLGANHDSPQQKLTWSQVTASIIYANCTHCHQAKAVGPFPLETWQDVVSQRAQMIEEIQTSRMPPWMPDANCGEFLGQRSLSEIEKQALSKWVEQGTPSGELNEAPAPPPKKSTWELGPPDLIAEMAADFSIPADGPDLFQNFVIPLPLDSDKVVAAIEFQPGDASVVHHALCFLDANHQGRKLDAKTPEPGYSSFGSPGFLPTGSIGGWSPGNTPRKLPGHMGRYLKKGSDLVLQIHYHPSGKATKDRSRVGIYFADQPKNIVAAVWAASYDIDIPAGERNYERRASYKLPQPVTLMGVIPHMHLLGKSFTAQAVLPDNTIQPIIRISNWKYAWQDEFHLSQPIHLPAGTRLEIIAAWDNSEENPLNPSNPPRRVTWGEQTTDEMVYGFFLVAAEEPKKLIPLALDNISVDLKSRALHGHPIR